MASLAVDIDFNNVYELIEISKDKRIGTFSSELINGERETLQVQISTKEHEKLLSVYNLSFGPLDKKGNVNDTIQLSHADYSKVFSTIILSAFNYLTENSTHYLGIDGSTFSRALLYFKFIQRNYNYLSRFFEIIGIKYYVRISRLGKNQYDDPFDFEDIISYPVPIVKGMQVPANELFNYYIFKLRNS